MIETVLNFYMRQEKMDKAELLRKAFYIKANPKLTRLKLISRNPNHQVDVFKSLLNTWGVVPQYVRRPEPDPKLELLATSEIVRPDEYILFVNL